MESKVQRFLYMCADALLFFLFMITITKRGRYYLGTLAFGDLTCGY